jgi:hypothetical protein
MSETIYFNGVNGKKTMYGTRISINVEKFIDELKKHKNEAGYCNINVKDRKAPDKYGNNVYITLDTWKPDPSKKSSSPAPQLQQADRIEDDLPF